MLKRSGRYRVFKIFLSQSTSLRASFKIYQNILTWNTCHQVVVTPPFSSWKTGQSPWKTYNSENQMNCTTATVTCFRPTLVHVSLVRQAFAKFMICVLV